MKVGVLGSGKMGESVIQHLQECPQVSAIAAYDIAAERVREVQAQYGVAGHTDLSALLADPELKLVFVTAANHAHKDLAVQALEAGKAVMCEKPIATTLEDARLMVETAERLGSYFQIGFELRYSLLYTKVKEWVDAGLLGQVVSTHCLYCSSARLKSCWHNRRDLVGKSYFAERVSHYVDLCRWWVGAPVTEVYSAAAPNIVPYTEVHDNYHTTYRFANGAVGHVSFYMGFPATFRGDPHAPNVTDLQLGDGHELRYIIVGTKGAAEADVFLRRIKRWEFSDTPEQMESDWVEDLTWDVAEDHRYYHNTYDQTHDIVRRVAAGLPPMTPARDAFETMRLCFAADESADTGRVVRLDE